MSTFRFNLAFPVGFRCHGTSSVRPDDQISSSQRELSSKHWYNDGLHDLVAPLETFMAQQSSSLLMFESQ
jgi:hypothetical protein